MPLLQCNGVPTYFITEATFPNDRRASEKVPRQQLSDTLSLTLWQILLATEQCRGRSYYQGEKLFAFQSESVLLTVSRDIQIRSVHYSCARCLEAFERRMKYALQWHTKAN